MFQGTNSLENESSRERTVQGTNVPRNEWSRERKFHHGNECSRERIVLGTNIPDTTKIGTEVAHVTRDSDTTFKVKGQGHQAALLTAVLAHHAAAVMWAWERVGHEKLLLRCCLLSGVKRFGANGVRRGTKAYHGGRPPTASSYYYFIISGRCSDSDAVIQTRDVIDFPRYYCYSALYGVV